MVRLHGVTALRRGKRRAPLQASERHGRSQAMCVCLCVFENYA
jgi:hypothetical protein